MEIPWEAVIWFLVSSLLIPVFVSWYSSDLRVAKMQRNRDHYIELVKTFEEWADLIHEYAPTEMYDPLTNEFTPPKTKPLQQINYYEQFLEHMNSGYPELWEKWTKVSSGIVKHNLAHAKLLNDIASEIRKIADENGIKAIFPYYEKDRPRFYVNLPKMTSNVIAETKYRLERYSPWFLCEIKYKTKATYPDEEIGYQWEQWGETVIIHDNIEEAERVINSYKSIVDNEVFEDRIYSIFENTQRWEKERTDFSALINQEIDKIRLGKDMKGYCSICTQFGILSRFGR